MDKMTLTAPCGLDCFNCEIFEDNLTNYFADFIHTRLNAPLKEIPCKDCRQQDGKHFHLPQGCATLDCVKARGMQSCLACNDFPCAFLAPVADEADKYPHNIKVFNLCRINKIGLQRWTEEEAGQIRNKYFTNRFIMGRDQAG